VLKVQGSGFKVQGSGFKVLGSGFKALCTEFDTSAGLKSGQFGQAKDDSVSAENSKSQIPNHKQIPMIKIQNSKPVWDIGYWNLRFIWNLVIVI
jgi:hypothetical protein